MVDGRYWNMLQIQQVCLNGAFRKRGKSENNIHFSFALVFVKSQNQMFAF